MGKNKAVLDLGSDSEDEAGGKFKEWTINKNYAERYDKWRGSEELQKLKDRYGDVGGEDDESSSSSEEEEWTADKEKQFFKTFSLLKKKDPKIYDSNVRFFESDQKPNEELPQEKLEKKSKKKEKAYLLKDHERKMLLEKGGLSDDDEDAPPKTEPTYVQEQESIKKGFSEALNRIESDDEGDDLLRSDLLKKRKKTDTEQKNDEDEYRKWLKGEVAKVKGTGADDDLKYLRDYWTDPNLTEDEKFLRDYILNQKYREPEDRSHVPTYDEIVHDSDEEGLSGDEANVQKMEDFEHKYNFRFEEPDPEFIKRYPRTVESSLRRADDKRKRQRESAKERKEAEKAKKREEIQRLKALKRQEIMEKIKQLEQITGNPELAGKIDEADIEGDFDPEEHDLRMQKLFGEEYYGEGEEEKPVFPYDEELDEEWKAYCPDEDLDEDEESEKPRSNKTCRTEVSEEQDESEDKPSSDSKHRGLIEELIEVSKGKKHKKKKSVFMEALERAKPKFDPSTNESFEKYFDEYYKLDFEDLVGDLPCRFKYRKVVPNDFGLSMDEILKAPDRELNLWASIKKTFQYRTPEEENYDLQAYKKKAESIRQKQKVLPSLFKTEEDDDEEAMNASNAELPSASGEEPKKKNKKKKKKKKKKLQPPAEPEVPETPLAEQSVNDSHSVESKKKKKKRKVAEDSDVNADIKVEDTEAYGTPKKKKNKTAAPSETLESNEASNGIVEERCGEKKKKKKHQNGETSAPNPVPDPVVQKEANGSSSPGIPNPKKRKLHQNQNAPSSSNKKRKHNAKSPSIPNVDDDRLRAYGINPTKFKKQLKYGNKN